MHQLFTIWHDNTLIMLSSVMPMMHRILTMLWLIAQSHFHVIVGSTKDASHTYRVIVVVRFVSRIC